MSHRIIAGSFTDEIYSLDFDPSSMSLTFVAAATVGHSPSWIICHPDDHSLIFAVSAKPEGKVVAVKFDENGKGKIVGQSLSGGAGPCSLLAATDELIVANVSCSGFIITPDN